MNYKAYRVILALVSGVTLAFLAAVLVLSLGAALWLAVAELAPSALPQSFVQPLIAGLAGISGSSFRALWSCCERIANGWEIGSVKLPDDSQPDKFNLRLVASFLCRPLLGAWVGLVLYAGLKGGSLLLAAERVDLSSLSLLFFAAIAGLFAKRFAESLSRHLP
jgi:hypothetical protein